VKGRGEPNWRPISALPMIATAIDGGLLAAQEQYETLLKARPKPYVLDDATIARTTHVFRESLECCDVYDEQLRRWRSRRLTPAQRRDVARVENANREARAVLTAILDLADELSAGTIERQLSKSDEQLGLEYLLGLHPAALTS
jgi:hypothetical protein